MRDTTERLGKVRASDRAQAFAVIGEAVWWVTIVDATLVRYYPDEYDTALAGLPAAQRRAHETTLAGLRFVRNRMGYYADHADFIQPCAGRAGRRRRADHRVDLAVAARARRGDAAAPGPGVGAEPLPRPTRTCWPATRVGETFGRTSAFLDLVAGTAQGGGRAAAGRRPARAVARVTAAPRNCFALTQ